jgi:septum formation protein
MEEAGFACRIVPSRAEEIHDASLSWAELTEENASLKASEVARREDLRGSLCLGADTLVYLEGEPLGKPRDMEEARQMLGRLAGKTHVVCSGVSFQQRNGSESVIDHAFHVLTRVTFLPLGLGEIDAYLSLINPLDKAGAYAAQEHQEMIISKVEGSWTNVVGLPMPALCEHLSLVGVSLPEGAEEKVRELEQGASCMSS